MRSRKQVRLKDFDYSKDGFYFITICSKNRENIFGDIAVAVGDDGCRPTQIALNDFGRIVDEELKKSQIIRNEIVLDHYVVMPNHVHCIVVIEQNHRGLTGREIAGRQPSAPTGVHHKRSLSSFVQGFKSAVTTRINTLRHTPGEPVWQRSFHDHIIRNERSLNAIREYIANNPKNWERDIDNLINL